MATKTFSKALMASEDIKSYVVSVKYKANNDFAAIHDGAFVKLGAHVADTTYAASGDIEYNLYEATAPTAVTDSVVVIDYDGVSQGTINGNDYKMGIKIYNLVCPAGRQARARRLAIGDQMWLSDGLFESAPTVGEYAELTANKTTLTPAASHTAGRFAVKIAAKKDFNVGLTADGYNYLVEVVEVK